MSRRFGRKQKQKLRAQLAEAERDRDDSRRASQRFEIMAEGCVRALQEVEKEIRKIAPNSGLLPPKATYMRGLPEQLHVYGRPVLDGPLGEAVQVSRVILRALRVSAVQTEIRRRLHVVVHAPDEDSVALYWSPNSLELASVRAATIDAIVRTIATDIARTLVDALPSAQAARLREGADL